MTATRTTDAAHELLVLGIVRRQPLSAYSIDRAIREHSPLYRSLGKKNVYHVIDRLLRGRYLSKRRAKAKRGPRSTVNVLGLSALGEERFQELLRAVITDPQSGESALEIAMVLLGQLPRSSAARLLAQRDDELAAQERRIKRLFGDMNKRSGPGYLAGSHALLRAQNERRFLRAALKQMSNARWHAEWQ